MAVSMATNFRPFRGMRFGGEAGQRLDTVTSPAWREGAAAPQAGCHVGRLMGATGGPKSHQAARALLKSWRSDGTLLLDAHPCYYLYRQEWSWGAERLPRSLWIGALAAEPFGASVSTFQQADIAGVEERLGLLQALRAQVEPLLFLHRGPVAAADLVARVIARPPLVDFQDGLGTEHRLWAVHDADDVEHVRSATENLPLVLAQGQVAYQAALRQLETSAARRPVWVLAALESAQEHGVVVLSMHRGLRGLSPELLRGVRAQLSSHFTIERWTRSLPELMHTLAGQGRLGLGLGRGLYLLQEKERHQSLAAAGLDPDSPRGAFDVFLLQELVLGRLLGLDRDRLVSGGLVDYSDDPYSLDAALDRGDLQLAFYLAPPRLDDLLDLAQQGERLPPRSAGLHPDLRAGLVMGSREGEPPG